jgi:hypothetical protein
LVNSSAKGRQVKLNVQIVGLALVFNDERQLDGLVGQFIDEL